MESTRNPGARTWHYGLIARWWALFRRDGPEVAFFRRYVEEGQPALDLACGTGRLLVPYLGDGLDVDGADVSADMLAYCRDAAREIGAEPVLYEQANHELDIPRSYRTIFCCGGFGLGGTADDDALSLRRAYEHLERGGTFVFDHQVDEARSALAALKHADVDGEEPPPDERRRGPDGDDYALRHRMLQFDPTARRGTRELHAWRWRGGELVAHERHELIFGAYTIDELVEMTRAAGFVDVRAIGGYDSEPVGPQHQFAVIEARRQS